MSISIYFTQSKEYNQFNQKKRKKNEKDHLNLLLQGKIVRSRDRPSDFNMEVVNKLIYIVIWIRFRAFAFVAYTTNIQLGDLAISKQIENRVVINEIFQQFQFISFRFNHFLIYFGTVGTVVNSVSVSVPIPQPSTKEVTLKCIHYGEKHYPGNRNEDKTYHQAVSGRTDRHNEYKIYVTNPTIDKTLQEILGNINKMDECISKLEHRAQRAIPKLLDSSPI